MISRYIWFKMFPKTNYKTCDFFFMYPIIYITPIWVSVGQYQLCLCIRWPISILFVYPFTNINSICLSVDQ